MKILSYNIHKGFTRHNRRYMIPNLRQAVRELSPDVMCLQEVQGEHREKRFKRSPFKPGLSDHDYLARKHWEYVVYGENVTHDDGHHGNAILSKFAFTQAENVDVSRYTKASRSLLHTVIQHHQKEIHIICVHLGLLTNERLIQFEQLIHRIENFVPHDAPLIIAGDFNDWRYHSIDTIEHALDLKEALFEATGHYGKTFPIYRPTLCVDRIYYRGLNLKSAEVLTGKPWRYLSDHLPLYAEFEVSP